MSRKAFALSLATSLAFVGLPLSGCGESSKIETDRIQDQKTAVQLGKISPAQLRAEVSDERVKRFYDARGWQPVWTPETTRELRQAMGEAVRHGLDPEVFRTAAGMQERGTPIAPAAREAALSLAALSYAEALARGRTDPAKIHKVYTIARPEIDLAAGLNRAVQSGEVGSWLASLAPNDAEYRAMSEAYLRYRKMAGQEGPRTIAEGETIHPGDRDPRIPSIAAALRENGYLGEDGQAARSSPARGEGAEAGNDALTPELVAAVKRMQNDFGIAADGIIGADTLAVLNTGPFDRARSLAVNLERRRWLRRDPPATRIDVNTAAALLDYWRDGEHVDHRRVVVGQPGNETPPLGSPIYRLVANPTWTVPKSIEEEEIAPKGPGYLRRNNMVRRDGWIVQQPGPDNALGQVKFDMKNDQAIYLHDTPAKALFADNQRHHSHGCVRVQNALGFARMLAEQDGKLAEFQRALASGKETFVDLSENIPVRLLYHSVFLDREGNLVFRTDPYGWDEDVAEALGLAARERPQFESHVRDVGP